MDRPTTSELRERVDTRGVTRGVDWHALAVDEVEGRLATSRTHGLTSAAVRARLERHGANQLEEQPPSHPVLVLARQFRSPLIYILLAAAVVTTLLGELIDASVITAILAINAAIGFVQERKAEGAVRALSRLVVPRAHVVRDGREWELDSPELVPGDVVLLEPGTRVPADLRIVSASALQIDESLLTGESLPVTKRPDPVGSDTPLADRKGMAYAGAIVTTGRGRGLVVATGTATELGAIAGLIRGETPPPTPLQRRMTRFGQVIGVAVGVASLAAFVSGVALGLDVHDMFITTVALAVAVIPEGLPVAFTITLALGVHRMARRSAIIRRLPAVETLGSTTVIGSDKTGTLTENRMAVEEMWAGGRLYRFDGEGADREITVDGESAALDEHPALHQTLLAGVLTNEAHTYRSRDHDSRIEAAGDPTEVALLLSAEVAGIRAESAREAYTLVGEVPFEPERRYSAALRERHGVLTTFVKGAPERVAPMCVEMLTDEGRTPIDHAAVEETARRLAGQGLRVLAMAMRAHSEDAGPADPEQHLAEPDGLVFLGLQGMMDPPRPGVREAIAACHDAGIRVVMITGDHADTGSAVAERLGIPDAGEAVLAGAALSRLSDEELGRRVQTVSVYARVAPEDKLRIVRALSAQGETVAVTGDGVNDAPALRAAAIGIAMGRSGTDVAREAADMVLADDDFTSIVAAVEEGRVTFDNVRKVTFFLVSTGAAMIVALLAGVWLRWPLLMLPAQLLWLNLVTNGLQDVALAFEPGEEGVLRRRSRRTDDGVLSRLLWERTAVAGVVMAAGTLALFRWELDRSGSVAMAQTVALTTMVVFMAFHVGNARSEHRSVFRVNPFSNPFLFLATLSALGVHVAALYLPPTQYVLRVEPIGLAHWMMIVVVAATILLAIEAHKLLRHPRTRVASEERSAGMVTGDRAGDKGPAGEGPGTLVEARGVLDGGQERAGTTRPGRP